MILMFLCQHGHVCVKTWKVNVFVKPNEQCQACSNIVVARKCTFRETRKEQLTRSLVTCLLINLSTYQLASVCQLSERNLTLWVPFLSTNRAPCRKKSILAKVCFDAKRGQSVNTIKWIFISRNRHLHHIWGYLRLNVLQFTAKHSAICR